jgi:hypothetical protein
MVGGIAVYGYSGAMLPVFQIQNAVVFVATLVVFGLQAWAFIDAVSHRPEAFTAADKLTKPAWLIILGIALGATILLWGSVIILTLVGAVAAIVYLVDVRPALRSLRRR